jgi:hypothetical protein
MLPYLLPAAHIGLVGSIYCTLALTVERYIAVCHPKNNLKSHKVFMCTYVEDITYLWTLKNSNKIII